MPLGLSSHPLETHLTALGQPVVVRSHGSQARLARKAVAAAWLDCESDPADGASVVDVLLDDDLTLVHQAQAEGLTASTSLDQLLHELSPVITEAVITRGAGTLLMFHAAAIANPVSGACVVFVAPSGTGKTTAARTLGRDLGYVSDETVGIRADLSIVAYPKPLSVLSETTSRLKAQTPASSLGLGPAPGTAHLAGVLFLDRDPSGPRLEVQKVPTVRALAELAPQTSYLAKLQSPLHRLAGALNSTGGLRRVSYREATELSELVRNVIGLSS